MAVGQFTKAIPHFVQRPLDELSKHGPPDLIYAHPSARRVKELRACCQRAKHKRSFLPSVADGTGAHQAEHDPDSHARRRAYASRVKLPTAWILAVAALASCAKGGTAPSHTPEKQAEAEEYVVRLEQRVAAAQGDAGIRYCLCAAYDDAGKVPDALKCLEALDARGWPVSIRVKHFHASAGSSEFQALLRRSDARETRVDRSRIAFTAPAELVPENVAFDPKTGAFFLGSVSLRKVVRIEGGRVQDFGPPNVTPPLLSILGMKIDAARRTLWAASEGNAATVAGRSELLLFDVDTGELRRRFAPEDAQRHLFNDVVVSSKEDVFVTDSVGGGIYRVSARGALRPFVPAGTFFYPNGIALSRDEKKLFVAYDVGIAVVDVDTGSRSELRNDSPLSIAGIDGLYVHRDELVAVQNGIGRGRVIRIRLDSEAARVTDVEILESGNPLFKEQAPTTGVLVGDEFHYIANYQSSRSVPVDDVRVLTLSLARQP